jgi:ribosomal protein S18 acetylase RimI-like enzyme
MVLAASTLPGRGPAGSVLGVEVRLQVLDERSPGAVLDAVEAIALAPGQDDFVLLPRATLPVALDEPSRTPFAVVEQGAGGTGGAAAGVVGFGVLDRHGYLEQVLDAPERTVLLRAFCIAAAHQGRGVGTAAARAARGLAASAAPSADLVVLTVSTTNAAGLRAYGRAGFVDTGARYAGSRGEEHVMAATVARPAAPARRRSAAQRASTGSR